MWRAGATGQWQAQGLCCSEGVIGLVLGVMVPDALVQQQVGFLHWVLLRRVMLHQVGVRHEAALLLHWFVLLYQVELPHWVELLHWVVLLPHGVALLCCVVLVLRCVVLCCVVVVLLLFVVLLC